VRATGFAVLLAIFLASHAREAAANSGIPGPLIWLGGSLTANLFQWIGVCMFMCIFVEGAIYKYWRLFSKPFAVSAYLNTVSLICGIPLIFLGALDPTWFVMPTAVSAFVEAFCGRRLPHFLRAPGLWKTRRGPFYWKIFLANLVSNAIMFAYLYKLMS
jgi:hypothetical protein